MIKRFTGSDNHSFCFVSTTSCTQGVRLGKKVGRFTIKHNLKKLHGRGGDDDDDDDSD